MINSAFPGIDSGAGEQQPRPLEDCVPRRSSSPVRSLPSTSSHSSFVFSESSSDCWSPPSKAFLPTRHYSNQVWWVSAAVSTTTSLPTTTVAAVSVSGVMESELSKSSQAGSLGVLYDLALGVVVAVGLLGGLIAGFKLGILGAAAVRAIRRMCIKQEQKKKANVELILV